MREKTLTLIILHTAVFLAGWTGIFGRLITLGGLPLATFGYLLSFFSLFYSFKSLFLLRHSDERHNILLASFCPSCLDNNARVG